MDFRARSQRVLKEETRIMTTFVRTLKSILALYGLADRGQRQRPAPVSILRSGTGRV